MRANRNCAYQLRNVTQIKLLQSHALAAARAHVVLSRVKCCVQFAVLISVALRRRMRWPTLDPPRSKKEPVKLSPIHCIAIELTHDICVRAVAGNE